MRGKTYTLIKKRRNKRRESRRGGRRGVGRKKNRIKWEKISTGKSKRCNNRREAQGGEMKEVGEGRGRGRERIEDKKDRLWRKDKEGKNRSSTWRESEGGKKGVCVER